MLLVGGVTTSYLQTGENRHFLTTDCKTLISIYTPGDCGFYGEKCTLIELTLINPTGPGSGSSSYISLTPP